MTLNEWIKAAHEPKFYRYPQTDKERFINNHFVAVIYDLISSEVSELLSSAGEISYHGLGLHEKTTTDWQGAKRAFVDALGDIMWLCAVGLESMEINYKTVIERIAESNATKLVDGDIYPDINGKLPKRAHYNPPKLDDLI